MSNVPKLRFKEFSHDKSFANSCGEWEDSKLKNFSLIYDGTHQTPKYTETGVPFVSVENINDINSTEKYISLEDFDKYKIKPKQNDILMTRITAGIIGATAIVKDDNPLAYYVSLALIRIKENKDINVSFLSQYINSIYFKKELHKRIIHTAFPKKINLGDIGECHSFLPSKQEQEKIASFLTSVDSKIEQLTKKEELLLSYKKGVMQKIFSGEIRFKADDASEFCEWEEKKLGYLCKLQGGYAFKSEQFRKSGIPVIRISNISNINNYINEENIVYYDVMSNDKNFTITNGDLLVAMSGATTGKASVYNLNEKAYLNQRVGLFRVNRDKLYYGYLVQFVFSNLFARQLDAVLVAGAQPNISSKDIEDFKLNLPCLEEQTKIANFLSSIDSKIEQVQKQLASTKEFKKALLQQMFV